MTKLAATLVVLLLAAITTACGDDAQGSPASTPTAATSDELAIMEAVFRHQSLRNSSGQQQSGVIFLAVGPRDQATDPPRDLMARLPEFEPLSESNGIALEGVTHRQTGEPGYILFVEAITMTGPDAATVTGGYYGGGLSASGNTYTVTRGASGWQVTGDVMHWIS